MPKHLRFPVTQTRIADLECLYQTFFAFNSVKVALGIGNCALGSYCLMATQVNHCIVKPPLFNTTKLQLVNTAFSSRS